MFFEGLVDWQTRLWTGAAQGGQWRPLGFLWSPGDLSHTLLKPWNSLRSNTGISLQSIQGFCLLAPFLEKGKTQYVAEETEAEEEHNTSDSSLEPCSCEEISVFPSSLSGKREPNQVFLAWGWLCAN